MSARTNHNNIWDGMNTTKHRKNRKYRPKNQQNTKINLSEFHNTPSKEPTSTQLNTTDIANQVQNIKISNNSNSDNYLKVSTICILQNLQSMSSMNGKSVRIIGPFNKYEQRYPVFVYDTKDIVLIKPSNLKINSTYKDNIQTNVSLKDQIQTILQQSNHNKRDNMAQLFANKLMKSNYNQLNTNLMDDFKAILQGNCIYIPHFFCRPNDFRLLNFLKTDIQNNDNSNEGMIDWSKHLKHENPSFSITFNMIIEYICEYFDMDVFASRLNFYRNGLDWKPYHHDSHAYDKGKNIKEDFTIGVSFGNERILSFKHVKTEQLINIPQKNGDCFAFNSIVNAKFMHGILKGNKGFNERFSIIAWGKRRSLNDRNSGSNERNRNNVFNGRYVT